MAFTVKVGYPKRIEIGQGTPIKALGTYSTTDYLSAELIHDAKRSITFQLDPDEIVPVEEYGGFKPWPNPLCGEVVGSSQWGERTILDVLPFERGMFDYDRLSTAWARGSVPAFWKLLDEKRRWESSFRDTSRFWKVRSERAQPLDVSIAVLAMRRYAALHPQFRLQFCTRYIWQSIEKQLLAARHLERLEVLYDLRRHFDAAPRDEVREWLLHRTQEESSLIFESATPFIFSSLDILSHVINEVYDLGFSGNNAKFNGVLFDRSATDGGDEEAQQGAGSLQRNYPEAPLTQFLLQERQEWIRDMETWRHHIIHHASIRGGMWVRLVTDAEGFMPKAEEEGDAKDLLTDWSGRLRVLLWRSAELLAEHLDARSEKVEATGRQQSPIADFRKPDESQAIEVMTAFLELWQTDIASQPKKLNFMYSRLSKDTQRNWTFPQFRQYVGNHPLREWEFTDGFTHGSGGVEGEHYGFCVRMSSGEEANPQTLEWRFRVVPASDARRLAIDLTDSLTVPPSFVRRVQLLNFGRRQSDRDTLYADLVFRLSLANISQVALQNVEVHIYWKDISEAHCAIGHCLPDEFKEFEVSWKDAFRPVAHMPGIAHHLMDETTLRIIYRTETEEGNWWSETITLPAGDVSET